MCRTFRYRLAFRYQLLSSSRNLFLVETPVIENSTQHMLLQGFSACANREMFYPTRSIKQGVSLTACNSFQVHMCELLLS